MITNPPGLSRMVSPCEASCDSSEKLWDHGQGKQTEVAELFGCFYALMFYNALIFNYSRIITYQFCFIDERTNNKNNGTNFESIYIYLILSQD